VALADAVIGLKDQIGPAPAASTSARRSSAASPGPAPGPAAAVRGGGGQRPARRREDEGVPGLYHVLGGTLSPLDGRGPSRFGPGTAGAARAGSMREVILATNPTSRERPPPSTCCGCSSLPDQGHADRPGLPWAATWSTPTGHAGEALEGGASSLRRPVKNPLLTRLLKKVQMQGGTRSEGRGVLVRTAAAPRERANAADGLFQQPARGRRRERAGTGSAAVRGGGRRLAAAVEKLCQDAKARAVFLIEKSGQLITASASGPVDTTSLASLAAGNIAASGGLAQLLGRGASTSCSRGRAEEPAPLGVGERAILVVLFDRRSTLDWCVCG